MNKPGKVGTCEHVDDKAKPDCKTTAVWRFPIMGIPTLACAEHLPQYAAKTATKV